jgi:phosphoribosylglycinamide formyltransferase-1
MLSGGGRTMVNLAAAMQRDRMNASIELVIASTECAGCERARERGFVTRVEPGVIDRERLGAMLSEARIDYVLLAGYLKLVRVPEAYRHRVVNIHPALLPSFGGAGMYGQRVHAAVLVRGCKVSGCTVHLVDDEFDSGPILVQRACEVREDDTPETLAARVFEQECVAYPAALEMLIEGRVRVDGRRAAIGDGAKVGRQ